MNYLAVFPGENSSNKIGETELNKILFDGMPNVCSKQVYPQGFYCEYITLKYVNMFERMEIAESIYEGFVEPSYKNLLGQIKITMVTSWKLEEKIPCQRLTLRWVKVLKISSKGMYIILVIHQN